MTDVTSAPVEDSAAFLKRLRRGPSVLFLGQRYLALERGHDPLLAEISRKFEIDPPLTNYFPLLELKTGMSIEAFLAWLDERCRPCRHKALRMPRR